MMGRMQGGDMKKSTSTFLMAGFGLLFAACGPKLSQEKYVNVMTELGCQMSLENTAAGEEVYKKFKITQADVDEFRKKSKPETMLDAANQIALSVAACHGNSVPLD